MKKPGFILLCLLMLLACSNPKKQMTHQVEEQEKNIEQGFSKEKADQLLVSYDTYIEKYPKDTTSRLYMAKGVELSILNNDPQDALKFIDLFQKNFPDDPKAGLMQFKKAVVYDLLMHDPLRAVAEYDIFIQHFPDDPMRKEAQNAIWLIQDPQAFMDAITERTDSTSQVGKNQ